MRVETYIERIRTLDELIARFEDHPDPLTRERAVELLAAVDSLHREGLGRLVEGLRRAGGGSLLDQAAADPIVTILLGLYGLAELDLPAEEPPPAPEPGFVPLSSLRKGKPDPDPAEPRETAAAPPARRVLVAGIGNVLRGDDGFGPAVVRALEAAGPLPPGVRAVELGIGGLGLVQELMDGYDALLVVDAVDRGREPGALFVLEPSVPELAEVPEVDRLELSAPHEAVLGRTLIVARSVGALPPRVRLVGCQPGETEELSTELSPALERALPEALATVRSLLAGWCGEP